MSTRMVVGFLLVLSAMFLPGVASAAPPAASAALVAIPECVPYGPVSGEGRFFLFTMNKNGPLLTVDVNPAYMTSDGSFAAFDSRGELFIANRHGGYNAKLVDGQYPGSISRFLVNSQGKAIPNGRITGGGLSWVHGLVFSSSGELFASNFMNQTISRFYFGVSGEAIPNTVNQLGFRPLGLAIHPATGDLFVAGYEVNTVYRYSVGPDSLTLKGSISIPNGAGNLIHGLAFNKGELFVCTNPDTVYRFTFDRKGNAVPNGFITHPSTIGAAFTDAGELLLSGIDRYAPAARDFTLVEQQPVPDPGGPAFYRFPESK